MNRRDFFRGVAAAALAAAAEPIPLQLIPSVRMLRGPCRVPQYLYLYSSLVLHEGETLTIEHDPGTFVLA